MDKLFKFIILVTFVGVLSPLFAQKVTQIQPKQIGNAIEINYKISGAKFNEKSAVTLFVSFDGGKTFKGPMNAVSGDVLIESGGGQKVIVWDAFKDVDALDGDMVFDLRAKLEKVPVKKEIFVQYTGGVMVSSLDYVSPFGIMVGQLGELGWFGAVRLNSIARADYTYNGEDMNEDILYQFTDKTKYPRLSALGGVTYQIGWKTFMYAGLGYGFKSYYQEIEELSKTDASSLGKKWVSIEAYQENGMEIEVGSILKFNNWNVSMGLGVFNFEHISINAGVGMSF